MNDQPLVSIITICLNSSRTIRRTIESVLNQTYAHIEYIIVDGGSTDATVEIIHEYRNKIATVISEKDAGISDAFNKGLSVSNGDYIQFINGDDVLHRDKILNSVKALEGDHSAAFVFGDIIKIDKQGKKKRVPGDPDYTRTIAYVMNRVNHPTMLVRKSMFALYGNFDTRWKIAMDYDWILRIHTKGEKGIYSPDIIVETEAGGVSDAHRFNAFRECRDISIVHGTGKLFAHGYYNMRVVKHLIYKTAGVRK